MTLDEYKARAKADLDNAFEKGKSQGGGGTEIEIMTTVSNVRQLSNILFANIPSNHLSFAFLINPPHYNEYIKDQILYMTGGFAYNNAVRYRNNTFVHIPISVEYDAAVTKGDVYKVLDLGKLLTAENLHRIMQGLSTTATGQTLTLPAYATVKATYDAKYGEGAWDILAASKTNWTIAYA